MPEHQPKLVFSFEVIERFARAWASIDGRLNDFERERDKALPPSPEDWDSENWTGHYLGYMAEARDLLTRAGCYVSTEPFPIDVETIEPSPTLEI